MSYHERPEGAEQAIPAGSFQIQRPPEPGSSHLKDRDPELYQAAQTILGALREDMLPNQLQVEIFEALSPGVRREAVARTAGLDASILATFKQQIDLVDKVLRRTFNEDGSTKDADTLEIAPKDALNLSLKVNQMMIRELPKVYSMARIQALEEAVHRVAAEHMTRDQQEALIAALEDQQTAL